jgi:hypothetical protein
MLRRIRQPRAERPASGQTVRRERLQGARTLQAGCARKLHVLMPLKTGGPCEPHARCAGGKCQGAVNLPELLGDPDHDRSLGCLRRSS